MCLLDVSILLLGSGSNAINTITIKQTARAVKQYLLNIYISSFESNDRYSTDDEYEIYFYVFNISDPLLVVRRLTH